MSPVQAGGSNITFAGPSEFAPLWSNFEDVFYYRAVISAGRPLMKIAGTDKIVGSVVRTTGGGAIVLLPVPHFGDSGSEDGEDDSDSADERTPRAAEFQTALLDLAARLMAGSDVEPLPAWAAGFRLNREPELRDQIIAKESGIEAARAQLTSLQSDLDRLEGRKRLVTGTGKALELEVRKVLELIGGKVREPEPGRDDWKVTFPEGEAVVEVKGLKGSAGERDAAQLEKWVSTHLEDVGTMPKGLLIVNGWRDMPIDQRTEPTFPDQMLKYSKSRGHCLATGLQMLGILQDVEAKPERAKVWRERLLGTVGPLAGQTDWRKILSSTPQASDSPGDDA